MPNWKKLITSGSDAVLNKLTVSNGITGSLFGTASYALNSPGGSSNAFPFSGSAEISGSLFIKGLDNTSATTNVRIENGDNSGIAQLQLLNNGANIFSGTNFSTGYYAPMLRVKNASDQPVFNTLHGVGDVQLGIDNWVTVDSNKRFIYKSGVTNQIFSISSDSNIGCFMNLYGSEHATKPSKIELIGDTIAISPGGFFGSTDVLVVTGSSVSISGSVQINGQTGTPISPVGGGSPTNYYGTGGTEFLSTPTVWLKINLDGTNYYIPAYP